MPILGQNTDEIWYLSPIDKKLHLNAHVDDTSEVTCSGLRLHLLPCFVDTRREASDETAHMHMRSLV